MIRTDPILSVHCSHLLPTASEVAKASELLLEQPDLLDAFERRVRIAGDTKASLARWVWCAKIVGHHGDTAASLALDAVRAGLDVRQKLDLDSILRSPPFDYTFLQMFTEVLPLGYHGVTKEGNPVLIIRYGAVDTVRLAELWERGAACSVGGANAFTMCFIRCVPEYVTRVLMFEESERQGRTVDRIVAIIDVDGAGRRHWHGCLRSFVQQYVQFSGPVYPEVISRVFVTNAPKLVSNVCWPIVKTLLTTVQGLKVSFFSASQTSGAMRQIISGEMLPPFLGGSCTCSECLSGPLKDGGSMAIWERKVGLPWRSSTVLGKAPPPDIQATQPRKRWRSCCSMCMGEDSPIRRAAPSDCTLDQFVPPRRGTPGDTELENVSLHLYRVVGVVALILFLLARLVFFRGSVA